MTAPVTAPVSAGVRWTTVVAVVLVAVVAAVVSYAHMREVAERSGEAWRSWLLPLSVDGLMVAASMVLLTRRRAGLSGGALAWCALLGGVGASLAANVAAADPTTTARVVAAWPAVAFAVAFELLLQQRRPAATESAAAEPQPVTVPPVPQGAPRARAADPVPAAPLRAVPTRPHPTPTGQPAERSAVRSAPAARTGPNRDRTDAQLSQAVRDLAEANGGPPSQYQVKQRLGVGSGRAARLLAELDTTTPAGAPARNGTATRKDGVR